MARNGARAIVTTPAPTTATKTAVSDTDLKASPRYKAVRRIKNVANTQIGSRIRLYQRSIAAAKDPAKIKVLEGKVEALNYALQVVNET